MELDFFFRGGQAHASPQTTTNSEITTQPLSLAAKYLVKTQVKNNNILQKEANELAKIIGKANTSFKAKDGTQVEGMTLYVTEPISREKGKGERADKIFLTTAKLFSLNFTPDVGNDVKIFYTRFGKVETLQLLDNDVLDP